MARTSFSTRDFERAREVLAGAYGDHVPMLHGDPGNFVLESESVQLDRFALDQVHYGSVVAGEYVPLEDTLVLALMRQGAFTVDDGEQHRLGPGDLGCFRPGRPQHIWSEDVVFDVARLDLASLGGWRTWLLARAPLSPPTPARRAKR